MERRPALGIVEMPGLDRQRGRPWWEAWWGSTGATAVGLISGGRDHWRSGECGFEEFHPDLLGNKGSQ